MEGTHFPKSDSFTGQTLDDAYRDIGPTHYPIKWTVKALEIIARHRQSGFLKFILTVIPALSEDNVYLLASTPPLSPEAAGLSPSLQLEQSENEIVNIGDGNHGTAAQNANNESAPYELGETLLVFNDFNASPIKGSNEGSNEVTISAHDDYMSSSYSYSSPSDDVSLQDYDCGEPSGGKYWNGSYWMCEDCDEEFSEDELEEGKHICGNTICFCDTPGFDLETDVCTCEPSSDEESIEDEPQIELDHNDGVWRCIDCLWEVEANTEDEGHCHCLAEPDADGLTPARRIELSQYDDFEPADSGSSGPESVDSEPDSEDEAFIDDDEPSNPELSNVIRTDEFQEPELSANGHGEAMDREPGEMDMVLDG
ncbi:MAG: hypothetical protein LQ352_002873 [Teloschistes flavicans]|nr:MAG: hypothetical protein LQ352_002873 [Teloschistes flavicans]